MKNPVRAYRVAKKRWERERTRTKDFIFSAYFPFCQQCRHQHQIFMTHWLMACSLTLSSEKLNWITFRIWRAAWLLPTLPSHHLLPEEWALDDSRRHQCPSAFSEFIWFTSNTFLKNKNFAWICFDDISKYRYYSVICIQEEWKINKSQQSLF